MQKADNDPFSSCLHFLFSIYSMSKDKKRIVRIMYDLNTILDTCFCFFYSYVIMSY